MTYNAIRRGPMGGDHYTQIHNFVFRDPRLTPQAMAVFGHISTHSQDWSTSAAKIARDMGMGPDAVRAALVCLKQHHYVVHDQDRDETGRVKAGWYFITDLPAQMAALGVDDEETVRTQVWKALEAWLSENPRSEPVCENAYRSRPATTKPKRIYPKSLRKTRRSEPV